MNIDIINFDKPVPKHVAVIMDGNGRWAKKHGFVAKLKKVYARTPKKTEEQLKVEKRLGEIDTEVSGFREKIKNLEAEYCKQTIKEDFFRKKLFDYREKMHLLEFYK